MNNIKKYRGMLNMTQKELAEKIGVARALIAYWELPEYTSLKLSNAKKISNVFGCSLIDLYGIDNFVVKPANDNEKMKMIKILYDSIDSDKVKEFIRNSNELWL